MFTFKYNIYCQEKVKDKFLVDKLVVDDNKNLVHIDKFYMKPLQIIKLLKYINLKDLQII